MWHPDELRFEAVSQRFGAVRALHQLTACFAAGQVHFIEGPNGSGKSTLLKLASGLLTPTQGELRVGGQRLADLGASYRRILGVVGHESMLYAPLSGLQNLRWAARLWGLAAEEVTPRIEALRAQLHLGAYLRRPVATYSRGQRQRLAMARALLPQPQVLVLDEPATGLDRSGVDCLAEVIAQLKARSALIIAVTHSPALRERCADRVLSLEQGRVVADSQEAA